MKKLVIGLMAASSLNATLASAQEQSIEVTNLTNGIYFPRCWLQLWAMNERDEAVEEIRRFRENTSLSDHYPEIVSEINEKTDYTI